MNKAAYKAQILQRFNKGFISLGLVHMQQVLQQIEDGTISDSKLTQSEYTAIWHQAMGMHEEREAKRTLRLRNKLEKLQEEDVE